MRNEVYDIIYLNGLYLLFLFKPNTGRFTLEIIAVMHLRNFTQSSNSCFININASISISFCAEQSGSFPR